MSGQLGNPFVLHPLCHTDKFQAMTQEQIAKGTPLSRLPVAFKPRRSACAARSREHELEQLRRMSIQDRVEAALSMRARFSWLKPKHGVT